MATATVGVLAGGPQLHRVKWVIPHGTPVSRPVPSTAPAIHFVSCGNRRFKCSSQSSSNGGLAPGDGRASKESKPAPPWTRLCGGAVLVVLLLVMVRQGMSSQQQQQPPVGGALTVSLLGRSIRLGERAPGWLYFALLMAAGFGFFVSEEALNVWVGACLGRCLDMASREALLASLSANMGYMLRTVAWVYWGVCISDMVPFYAGKFAAQTTTGDQIRQKLGIGKQKMEQVSRTVRRYGNFIGFVERLSIGARNPTSFLAGASGVAPSKFFAGVCIGCLITLPVQLSIGFLLRDRPVTAVTGVAAAVGLWTIVPYVAAAVASAFFFLSRPPKASEL